MELMAGAASISGSREDLGSPPTRSVDSRYLETMVSLRVAIEKVEAVYDVTKPVMPWLVIAALRSWSRSLVCAFQEAHCAQTDRCA